MCDPNDAQHFYRDLFYKVLGYGFLLVVAVAMFVLNTGEKEQFSLRDPSIVANEVAVLEGEPDTREYKRAFYYERIAADMRNDRAKGYLCLIIGSLVGWGFAIGFLRHKCDSCPGVLSGAALFMIWFFLAGVHAVMIYLIFSD